MEEYNAFRNIDNVRVRNIVGEILSRADSMLDILIEQKFDTDSIYYHINWYISGARDVMLLDNSISTNDFGAAKNLFDNYISKVAEKIGYNDWSRHDS